MRLLVLLLLALSACLQLVTAAPALGVRNSIRARMIQTVMKTETLASDTSKSIAKHAIAHDKKKLMRDAQPVEKEDKESQTLIRNHYCSTYLSDKDQLKKLPFTPLRRQSQTSLCRC
ncbi:hypothetical protein M427DRAFT_144077 [Gonapodya prolifera JEL478]|uniref:Uncharacterized protein n=1 Tax=Gonapodya prolifera (strain JEL478) TaxID=1344416 RepID=A0A139AML1_GONPJ|nr:hypothetical protein M427DRAFT_144077 [Gonapodya prolifera JEL478]|eukprot:KXS17989.1 hypothetical protein M427DRAFT_144077 [Gonapodya prolifera JEL478]